MNQEFYQFLAVVGGAFTTTVALIVWVVKANQRNMDRMEERMGKSQKNNEDRVEKLTDRYITSMEKRDHALTEGLESMSKSVSELAGELSKTRESVEHLYERVEKAEIGRRHQ